MIGKSVVRLAWRGAGLLSLVVGIIGIFVPLLPTVPFLLLSAFCFERGSQRLHNWLINHERFGPPIKNWRRHGAISKNAKIMAMIAIVVLFAISLYMAVPYYVLAIQLVVLSAVCFFILSRPLPPPDEQV